MSRKTEDLKVVALAGGVGGAKLVLGLDRVLTPGNLSVIVNTGDDFEHFGLKICPDLDTICYTLADLVDKTRGWGLADESYQVSNNLESLYAPTWFTLGDKDIAVHLERTRLLDEGHSLSQVTQHFCKLWGVKTRVYPMSDQPSPTLVNTKEHGLLSFQEYFVKHHFQPEVLNLDYQRTSEVRPTEELLAAMNEADLVVICPSNPLLSIAPILDFDDIRAVLKQKPVIAVSPIIQGQALKGPAAKMFKELNVEASSMSVLEAYRDVLNLYVFDKLDELEFENYHNTDIIVYKAQTIMKTEAEKIRLARELITQGLKLLEVA